MTRHYTTADGTQYPLSEARYDMMFKVYKSDRRKCIPCDPHQCLLAKGILRHPDVLDVYVGAGCDAYVVFKATRDEPARAVHFGIRTKARKVIDAFDTDKKLQSETIVLCKPPHAWRLDVRRDSNARRRKEIKDGAPVTKRGKRAKARVGRYGAPRRPLAPLSKSGHVNTEAAFAE